MLMVNTSIDRRVVNIQEALLLEGEGTARSLPHETVIYVSHPPRGRKGVQPVLRSNPGGEGWRRNRLI